MSKFDKLDQKNRPEKEAAIQKRCVDKARRYGWLAYKFSSPSQRGVPDYIFIKYGEVVFVEFKRPGNTPTRMQQQKIDAIRAQNVEVHVIDCIEDFNWFVLGEW